MVRTEISRRSRRIIKRRRLRKRRRIRKGRRRIRKRTIKIT